MPWTRSFDREREAEVLLDLAGEVTAFGRTGRGYVAWVQRSLNRVLGTRLAEDGRLGPQTRSAIRSFQQRKGLKVDGIVGLETERALIASGAGAPPQPTVRQDTVDTLDQGYLPKGPFGTLTITTPKWPAFTYTFTPEDVLWTARFIVGEAGGRDDPDNAAVIWAMMNRYALLHHRYFPSFHQFIRRYSTTLQPVLRSWQAAKRHMNSPHFVRTGGFYTDPKAPPGIPRGQLQRHIDIQNTPWQRLSPAARGLALRALSGEIPNPIGNATDFASTNILFKSRYGRAPTDLDFRRYTVTLARQKGSEWIGDVPGINQRKNAFFVRKTVLHLPRNSVRVLWPEAATRAGQGGTSDGGGMRR
jgi:hypothetical protein